MKLIVVSHDREFLDGLVGKVFEFRDHAVREHLGGIYDFLRRRNVTSLKEIERRQQSGSAKEQPAGGSKPASGERKLEYQERREQEKKMRKVARRVRLLEKEIEEIEKEITQMDRLLVDPVNVTGMHVYEEYEKLRTRHDEVLEEWEKQSSLLERMKG